MQFMNQQVLANCTDLRHLFLSQNEIAKVPPKLLEVILIFFIFIPMIFVHYYSFRQNRCSKQSICREINWLQFQKASPRIVFTTLWDQWSIVYRICHQHPIFVSKYDMGHIVRRTFVKIQKACDEFGKRLFEWKFPRTNPNWHFG